MARALMVLAACFAVPSSLSAQQAICDCCMVPYTVPGASWIGTYRMPRQPPHRAFQDAPSRTLAAIVDGARNGTFGDGMLQVVRRDFT